MTTSTARRTNRITTVVSALALIAVFTIAGLSTGTVFAASMHDSTIFMGPKANTGHVTHTTEGGKSILTLSDDFKVPETPDPHWQLVDSKGNVYLVQKLAIKGDKVNRRIEVPSYVHDVSKVVIWCAFAEVNLGEASFAQPVK